MIPSNQPPPPASSQLLPNNYQCSPHPSQYYRPIPLRYGTGPPLHNLAPYPYHPTYIPPYYPHPYYLPPPYHPPPPPPPPTNSNIDSQKSASNLSINSQQVPSKAPLSEKRHQYTSSMSLTASTSNSSIVSETSTYHSPIKSFYKDSVPKLVPAESLKVVLPTLDPVSAISSTLSSTSASAESLIQLRASAVKPPSTSALVVQPVETIVVTKQKHRRKRRSKMKRESLNDTLSHSARLEQGWYLRPGVMMIHPESRRTLKVFKSIAEATNELQISSVDINLCCINKKSSAGGYIWRFESND